MVSASSLELEKFHLIEIFLFGKKPSRILKGETPHYHFHFALKNRTWPTTATPNPPQKIYPLNEKAEAIVPCVIEES